MRGQQTPLSGKRNVGTAVAAQPSPRENYAGTALLLTLSSRRTLATTSRISS
jgi:hypothetical protein